MRVEYGRKGTFIGRGQEAQYALIYIGYRALTNVVVIVGLFVARALHYPYEEYRVFSLTTQSKIILLRRLELLPAKRRVYSFAKKWPQPRHVQMNSFQLGIPYAVIIIYMKALHLAFCYWWYDNCLISRKLRFKGIQINKKSLIMLAHLAWQKTTTKWIRKYSENKIRMI